MCGIFCFFGNQEGFNQENLRKNAQLIKHRGPDNTHELIYKNNESGSVFYTMFHRLSINDISRLGDQPFEDDHVILVCNGEIYNHNSLEFENNVVTNSHSDCEIILHLYKQYGIERTLKLLDGVYAFVLYDKKKDLIYVARDRIGVRPLFMGLNDDGVMFCSEMKSLHSICKTVKPFPPSGYSSGPCFNKVDTFQVYNLENPKTTVKSTLSKSVLKRLITTERPIGFLLSGGLDSSLIVSIASKLLKATNKPIHMFSIGNDINNDLKYANMVADYISKERGDDKVKFTVVPFNFSEAVKSIPDVIRSIETYDVTTIRASTPMWLLCKYISENTDIKVIFSGEGADELAGGYLYHKCAPNDEEWEKEVTRLLDELYYFDVLRADRCTAAHGLELRVPFLDTKFLDVYRCLPTNMKNTQVEKEYLRKVFSKDFKDFSRREKSPQEKSCSGFLPDDVLWRQKEALSDGIGHGWVNTIKRVTNEIISDEKFKKAKDKYPFNTPKTKEAYWYRKVFESIYPSREKLIPHYWMPRWQSEDIVDPSATVLKHYDGED